MRHFLALSFLLISSCTLFGDFVPTLPAPEALGPDLTDPRVQFITPTSAELLVNADPAGRTLEVWFSIGLEPDALEPLPADQVSQGPTSVARLLQSLLPGTRYFFRAEASFPGGSLQTEVLSFCTPFDGTLFLIANGVATEYWLYAIDIGSRQILTQLGPAPYVEGAAGGNLGESMAIDSFGQRLIVIDQDSDMDIYDLQSLSLLESGWTTGDMNDPNQLTVLPCGEWLVADDNDGLFLLDSDLNIQRNASPLYDDDSTEDDLFGVAYDAYRNLIYLTPDSGDWLFVLDGSTWDTLAAYELTGVDADQENVWVDGPAGRLFLLTHPTSISVFSLGSDGTQVSLETTLTEDPSGRTGCFGSMALSVQYHLLFILNECEPGTWMVLDTQTLQFVNFPQPAALGIQQTDLRDLDVGLWRGPGIGLSDA